MIAALCECFRFVPLALFGVSGSFYFVGEVQELLAIKEGETVAYSHLPIKK